MTDRRRLQLLAVIFAVALFLVTIFYIVPECAVQAVTG